MTRSSKHGNYPSLDSHAVHRHSSHSDESKSLQDAAERRSGGGGSKDSGGGGGDTFRKHHVESRHKFNYSDLRSSMRTDHKEKSEYR